MAVPLPLHRTIVLVIAAVIVQADALPNPEKLSPSKRSISTHPIIIVVSYDGFRADYLHRVKVPVLHELQRAGVTVPFMEPVFPTKTFPNHQSIATGVYAESHGIVDNTVFDPLYNKKLRGSKDDPGFWNYNPDVIPIWIHNELAGGGRVSGCMMWSGSSQPYGVHKNLLPTYYPRKYDDSVTWESRVDTVISWITNPHKPANLVFLYFENPDSLGHTFGPNDHVTLEDVEKADKRTAYLVNKLQEAGIFERVNLIFVSDHGMEAVTQKSIINLAELYDKSHLVEAQYGGTPLLQLTAKLGRENDLYQILSFVSHRHNFTVWKKEELRAPYFYTTSRRISNVLVLADPGYVFEDFIPSIKSMNKKHKWPPSDTREYGVHGYTNQVNSMRPFFIAHGPAIRRGVIHPPIKNVDIVPLISAILRIPEPPSNGSLSRVADMIDPKWFRFNKK